MNNDLSKLVEAVRAAHADIAPTYAEYVQLAFAIATDCGEAGRSDFISLCEPSPKFNALHANNAFPPVPCAPETRMSIWAPLSTWPSWRAWK